MARVVGLESAARRHWQSQQLLTTAYIGWDTKRVPTIIQFLFLLVFFIFFNSLHVFFSSLVLAAVYSLQSDNHQLGLSPVVIYQTFSMAKKETDRR